MANRSYIKGTNGGSINHWNRPTPQEALGAAHERNQDLYPERFNDNSTAGAGNNTAASTNNAPGQEQVEAPSNAKPASIETATPARAPIAEQILPVIAAPAERPPETHESDASVVATKADTPASDKREPAPVIEPATTGAPLQQAVVQPEVEPILPILAAKPLPAKAVTTNGTSTVHTAEFVEPVPATTSKALTRFSQPTDMTVPKTTGSKKGNFLSHSKGRITAGLGALLSIVGIVAFQDSNNAQKVMKDAAEKMAKDGCSIQQLDGQTTEYTERKFVIHTSSEKLMLGVSPEGNGKYKITGTTAGSSSVKFDGKQLSIEVSQRPDAAPSNTENHSCRL